MKTLYKLLLPVLVLPFLAGAQTGDLRAMYSRLNSYPLPIDSGSRQSMRSMLETGNQKIDPALRLLMNQAQGRGLAGMAQAAKDLAVPITQGQVEVSVYADNGADPDVVSRRIADAGGEVSGVVENVVLAHVPLSAISRLGSDRDVYYVEHQGMSYADSQDLPGRRAAPGLAEGVLLTKANKLHDRGIRGAQVKIGILDFGYGGYHALEAKGLVPTPVAVRSFPKPVDLMAASNTVHGAACSEIIHAMAPDAALYLAMVGDGSGTAGNGDIVEAARWLAEQHVDVISYSGGSHFGPLNGNGMMDKLVEEVTAKGILWVNAAGNEGDRHWSGLAVDRNGDGFVDIGPHGEPGLAIQVGNCGAPQCGMAMLITWDDWGPDPMTPAATEDLDAYLFTAGPDGKPQQVAQSENPQQGRGAPVEFIAYSGPPNAVYLLALRMTHITRPVRIHIVAQVPWPIFPVVKDGSIGIPATSDAALGVAAVDVINSQTESYSSRGPTDDNRMKPDVAAPDNTLSTAYQADGHQRFQGTSAACPHVAGFAALLKQMNPKADAPALRKIVMQATHVMGSAPDNNDGHGMIDADAALAAKPGGGTGRRTETVEVPATFGGRISAAALDRLLEAAGPDSTAIQPKVVVGREVYRPGDGLKIGFKVERDCYYLLVHRDSAGKYTVLAPTPNGRTRLTAGEKYTEPAGENRTIKITPPAGIEHVILICADDDADLENWRPGSKSVAVSEAHYEIRED
jgi:subtilisin family serine protease